MRRFGRKFNGQKNGSVQIARIAFGVVSHEPKIQKRKKRNWQRKKRRGQKETANRSKGNENQPQPPCFPEKAFVSLHYSGNRYQKDSFPAQPNQARQHRRKNNTAIARHRKPGEQDLTNLNRQP